MEAAWIGEYRRLWASRFDALDQVVKELKQKGRRPMGADSQSDPTAWKARTTAERTSERELVFTCTINGPARPVFDA